MVFVAGLPLLLQAQPAVQDLLQRAGDMAGRNYDSALRYAEEAIALSRRHENEHDLALAYKMKGFCLYFKGSYPAALEHYQKSEKLAEEKGYADVLLSLHNLKGTFYKKQHRLKEARGEFEAGVKLASTQRDSINIANFKNDLGLVCELEGKVDEAIALFREALDIFEAHHDQGGMSYSLDYLGEAYSYKGDYKRALQMMLWCLDLRKGSGLQAPIAINLNNIGELFVQQKDFASALPYLSESEKIAASIQYADLQNHTRKLLARCYYQLGEYKKAYEMYERATVSKDSIYNEKNARIISETEAKYQSEKKQLLIESLNQQNELKEARLSKQKITIGLMVSVALLCAAGVIFAVRSTRRIQRAHRVISEQKQLVEEKQKEILDSIHYARRIQHSLLTSGRYIERELKRLQARA